VRLETEVIDGHGGDRLDGLTLRDKRTGQTERVQADALFVLIGGEPCTQWLPKAVQLEDGYS
jgi:thioredoxin reductase (NADPH)